MHWKLKVSEYGKIKSAEIETAPLTLFVGDNNSGKSYLMSLLWAIQNFGVEGLIGYRYSPDSREKYAVMDWLKKQIEFTCYEKVNRVSAGEIAMDLQTILQEGLKYNKNNLVSWSFNTQDIKIEKMEIELERLEEVFLSFKRTQEVDTDCVIIQSNIEGAYKFTLPLSSWEKLSVDGRLFKMDSKREKYHEN